MKRTLFCLVCLVFHSASVDSAPVRVLHLQGMNTYRLAVLNKGDETKQRIIGTTYDHEIFATNLRGTLLWKDRVGGFCFDLATADLTGDGRDEVILGCADDTLYCYDRDGRRLWARDLQSGPIYCVATIASGGKRFILAGTVLNDLFVLAADGATAAKKRFKGAVRELLVCDFDGDGVDDVYVDRAVRDSQQFGALYAFPSLERLEGMPETPLQLILSSRGQNAAVVRERSGKSLIFYEMGYFDPTTGPKVYPYDNNSRFTIRHDEYADAYRARLISAGNYLSARQDQQVVIAYGDELLLYSSAGKLLGYVRTKLGFNDVVTVAEDGRDKALLASAPNGDDNLYLVSLDDDGRWIDEMEKLTWTGQMRKIAEEYSSLQQSIDQWQGTPLALPAPAPLIVQINGEQGNGLSEETMDALIARLKREHAFYRRKFPYPDRLKFVSRILIDEDFSAYFKYRKPDGTWVQESKKGPEGLSRETILKFARKMEAAGIPFYTKAHGVQVSLETYKAMMDAAPTACLGIGIVEYSFLYSFDGTAKKGKRDYFTTDFLLPLMDYCRIKGKHVWFHCKGAIWAVRTPKSYIQHGIMDEKYKHVVILSNEDSNSRSPDLNTAARVGAWYVGFVDNWGYRWVSDIPAFSRLWDWSRTNTGHPAARSLLAAVSLGATYLNICSRQYDSANGVEQPSMFTGIEQFLHLLGKGIIAPPARENLRNISPVTLSLNEDLVDDVNDGGSGGHDFIFTAPKHPGYLNPDGFGLVSKLDVVWGCAPTPETDFAFYAYGRRQQAHNHIPNLSHGFGYVALVPKPLNRPDIDISYFTARLNSDGSNAFIGGKQLTLAEARKSVLAEMERATKDPRMFPVRITGDVFSSVNRMGHDRYLVYVIDPNLMSPVADQVGILKANARGIWEVQDRVTGRPLGDLSQPLRIEVPAGSFRILEVQPRTGANRVGDRSRLPAAIEPIR